MTSFGQVVPGTPGQWALPVAIFSLHPKLMLPLCVSYWKAVWETLYCSLGSSLGNGVPPNSHKEIVRSCMELLWAWALPFKSDLINGISWNFKWVALPGVSSVVVGDLFSPIQIRCISIQQLEQLFWSVFSSLAAVSTDVLSSNPVWNFKQIWTWESKLYLFLPSLIHSLCKESNPGPEKLKTSTLLLSNISGSQTYFF